MAQKSIRVINVVKSPAKKMVVLHVGNHRYLTSDKVLAAQGVMNPFTLRNKTITIETYEPGEMMVNNQAYEQREDSTLVKSIVSLPEMSLNEMIASEVAASLKTALLGSLGNVAPSATPITAAPTVEAGAAAEEAAPAEIQPGEQAQAAQPAAAAVVDEALPE